MTLLSSSTKDSNRDLMEARQVVITSARRSAEDAFGAGSGLIASELEKT